MMINYTYRLLSLTMFMEEPVQESQVLHINPSKVVPEHMPAQKYAKLVESFLAQDDALRENFSSRLVGNLLFNNEEGFGLFLNAARHMLGPICSNPRDGTHHDYRKPAEIVDGWDKTRYSFIMDVQRESEFSTGKRLIRLIGFTDWVPHGEQPKPDTKLFVSHYVIYTDLHYSAKDGSMTTEVMESNTMYRHLFAYERGEDFHIPKGAGPYLVTPAALTAQQQVLDLKMDTDGLLDLRQEPTNLARHIQSKHIVPSLFAADMINVGISAASMMSFDTDVRHFYSDMYGQLIRGSAHEMRQIFRDIIGEDTTYRSDGIFTYQDVLAFKDKQGTSDDGSAPTMKVSSEHLPRNDAKNQTTPALMALLQQLDVVLTNLGYKSWNFTVPAMLLRDPKLACLNRMEIANSFDGEGQGQLHHSVKDEAIAHIQHLIADFQDDLNNWSTVHLARSLAFSGSQARGAYIDGQDTSSGRPAVYAFYPSYAQSVLIPLVASSEDRDKLCKSVFDVVHACAGIQTPEQD